VEVITSKVLRSLALLNEQLRNISVIRDHGYAAIRNHNHLLTPRGKTARTAYLSGNRSGHHNVELKHEDL
jgi:hypothetical protein